MNTLRVELGERSYPIYIGDDLISDAGCFTPHIRGGQVMIVSNQTIAPLYLDTLSRTLHEYEVHVHLIPDGETHKNIATLHAVIDALLEVPCNRQTTMLALGGGVVGDVAGFAAACYQRGIPFIQVPTTLLAQVDSSVGGKTGVNHPLGKNMIGAFYQPLAVVVDTRTLESLNDREFRAGLAEVVKYGLIRDRGFFEWLEQNMELIMARDRDALQFAIKRCCEIKADVVAHDEREQGLRAILNLGHTFGHAIETATRYVSWLHGEAIAVGMIMASHMSRHLQRITQSELDRIEALIRRIGLPVTAPSSMNAGQFLSLMNVDKKNLDHKIRLVLLHAVGDAVVTDDYPPDLLNRTLQHFTGH